jgi:hypothetical protein
MKRVWIWSASTISFLRANRPEKDGPDELNIPKSPWAMKDNFCGNVAGKRKKDKTPSWTKKISPSIRCAEGLWRGSQIVKRAFMFSA